MPGRHAVHALAPVVLLKEPALQRFGSVDPIGHALPRSHGVHSEEVWRLVAFE